MQKALPVLRSNSADEDSDDDDDDDTKRPDLQLNPLVVSMLALPLLQIVSLPAQTIADHTDRDGDHTARDHRDRGTDHTQCQATARHLLSAVNHYATQHHRCRHGDAQTSSLW